MILSIIELAPISKNRDKALELLRFIADRVETRQGCLRAGVYQASDEKGTIVYLERWESIEEFRRYVRSNLYLNVLNALDLSQELPVVNIYEVSNIKAMEFIVALRNSEGLSVENE